MKYFLCIFMALTFTSFIPGSKEKSSLPSITATVEGYSEAGKDGGYFMGATVYLTNTSNDSITYSYYIQNYELLTNKDNFYVSEGALDSIGIVTHTLAPKASESRKGLFIFYQKPSSDNPLKFKIGFRFIYPSMKACKAAVLYPTNEWKPDTATILGKAYKHMFQDTVIWSSELTVK